MEDQRIEVTVKNELGVRHFEKHNLYIAHRKIPRKFGVPGYHRFGAAPPTHVCGGRTDGFAIARTNIALLGSVRQ